MEILYTLLIFIIGIGLGYYAVSRVSAAHKLFKKESEMRIQALEEKNVSLIGALNERETTIIQLRNELSDQSQLRAGFESQCNELQQSLEEWKIRFTEKEKSITDLSNDIAALKVERASLATHVKDVESNIEEQKRLLTVAEEKLKDAFNSIASDIFKSSSTEFLKLAQERMSTVQAETKGDLDLKKEEIQNLVKPLADALKRYQDELSSVERQRQNAYGGITETLRSVAETQQRLQSETTNLVNALKRPQVKGRWGEITLQRVVELAGMSEYCDFETQVSTSTGEGRLRPDMIVRLPNNRLIVVDAKVSLGAYLDAIAEGVDETTKAALFQKHAQQVRTHMKDLSGKAYWNQFTPSPDFVVMFLPGDPFLGAALEHDRTLIEDAITNRVLLATPTTLVAVLRAIAYGWKQEQLAENAQRIADEGKTLYERLSKFVEHFDNVGKGLDKAVQNFNQAMRSWDSRVLPSAKRLKELGAAAPDKEIESFTLIEHVPHTISQNDSESKE